MSLPFGKPIIGKEEESAVLDVLRSGILVHGKKAKEFEEAFAAFTKSPHTVSVGSCTAGLHLAYVARGIGKGDEVIVPAQTHVATAHAVELAGATPVFVDAEPRTGNIDIDKIKASITERTKAISIVHFLGMPVAMDRIMEIARKHNLFVVEDAALAIGSKYKGTHAGLFGDVGCFSFYPVKHITTAEGGMVTARDAELAGLIARKKAFGLDRTVTERKIPGIYDVTMLGFNYRMNEIAAVLGIEQLKRVRSFLEVRRQNYEQLESQLRGMSGITLLQSSYGDFESSYYCLSIILNDDLAAKRFEVVKFLKDQGIGTSVYYPKAVPMMTYYKEKYGYEEGDFPVAERISNQTISLPVGPHLNLSDMRTIAGGVKEAIASIESKRFMTVTSPPHNPATASLRSSLPLSLHGKRIALIGGAGFIGHNLALELKRQGADVHVIDGLQVNNLLSIVASTDKNPNRKMYLDMLMQRLDMLHDAEIPVHVKDVRNYHQLSLVLHDLKPQVIVHLAAVAHANRSNKDPYSTFDHSLRTIENSLDAAKGHVEHFIYFSSSMVYGNFAAGEVTEETPCEPLGIYGALKFAGEKMVIAYNQVFDLPYTIIRPSALYGQRCISRRVGQIFVENALKGKEIVVSGDGSDRLDFTYINDLMHGVTQILERDEAKNQLFNLTYGSSRSIGQMADMIKQHFPDVNVRYEPKDKLMPDRGTLSVEKAKRLIGYDPQYPLERGYVEYIDWYKQTFQNPELTSTPQPTSYAGNSWRATDIPGARRDY